MKRLPDSICSLYNLQTLNLRYCGSLEKLPTDLHKLVNLRHLDFFKTKVREMPKKLSILELQNVMFPKDALASNLKSKMYLEELKLKWSKNNSQSLNDKDVLEQLQPHQNLRKLLVINWRVL